MNDQPSFVPNRATTCISFYHAGTHSLNMLRNEGLESLKDVSFLPVGVNYIEGCM